MAQDVSVYVISAMWPHFASFDKISFFCVSVLGLDCRSQVES